MGEAVVVFVHRGTLSSHEKEELLEEVFQKYGDVIDVALIQLNYMDWTDQRIQSKKIHKSHIIFKLSKIKYRNLEKLER